MVQSLEDFDFTNSRDWKAILLLFGINALKRDNFVRHLVLPNKDAAIGSLTDLLLFRKHIYISKHNRRSNRQRATARALRMGKDLGRGALVVRWGSRRWWRWTGRRGDFTSTSWRRRWRLLGRRRGRLGAPTRRRRRWHRTSSWRANHR